MPKITSIPRNVTLDSLHIERGYYDSGANTGTISFSDAYDTPPLVLTQVDGETIGARECSVVAVSDVTTTGFDFRIRCWVGTPTGTENAHTHTGVISDDGAHRHDLLVVGNQSGTVADVWMKGSGGVGFLYNTNGAMTDSSSIQANGTHHHSINISAGSAHSHIQGSTSLAGVKFYWVALDI